MIPTMNLKLFSLGSNDVLAQAIAEKLGAKLGEVKIRTFADGERHVQFLESLRGESVYLIQSTNPPAENLFTLLLAIDAARHASAKEITVVMPYFGYARQDRKAKPREPISARVVAMMVEQAGADRILTMDLHNAAIGGFFRDTIVDYLYARPVFIERFQKLFTHELADDSLVVVSPDAGGVARAQSYAKRLMQSADLAIIHKEREIPNQIARMKLIGDVRGKVALIIDDMADTCGTLARAASVLKESGATAVYAATTHGLLSRDANTVIDASALEKLFITDTLPSNRTFSPKVEVVSIADIFADAIKRISTGESLSELFDHA